MEKLKNSFSKIINPISEKAKQGSAGFDNIRENIDENIITKCIQTRELKITTQEKINNLNADMLDGLHDTSYTKTTAGQTINVATAAELTAALAGLAAAPSLLGNVTIQLAAGTYTGNFIIPSLLFNGFTLTIQGTYTETLGSTTATGGNAGSYATPTQPNVVKTGAGWTVNAYKDKIIKFTSGTNNGLYRLIDTNTADTLTLCGETLLATPANGDTFKIYTWGSIITSTSGNTLTSISANGLILTALKISQPGNSIAFTDCSSIFYECWLDNPGIMFVGKNTGFYHCVFTTTTTYKQFTFRFCLTNFYGCKFSGSSTAAGNLGFAPQFGMTFFRNLCVVDTYEYGIYLESMAFIRFLSGVYVRNCTTGVYLINGCGGQGAATLITYSGCGTNYSADANSWVS